MSKVKEIAIKELEDFKYLYNEHLEGFIGTVFYRAGVPRLNPIPEEHFYDIKEAICDVFHGGCEPEFETEEEWKRFESIDNEHFMYVIESSDRYSGPRSPFQDKSIPFLAKVE